MPLIAEIFINMRNLTSLIELNHTLAVTDGESFDFRIVVVHINRQALECTISPTGLLLRVR